MAKKTYQTLKNLRLRTSAWAVASCLALSALPLAAQAAGLGKVTVFSALGQPLRAEVELSATREELSGMRAQLASPDAFKQAGLDYAATLMSIKFVIDKRANGQSIIRLSSDKPINDPFVDMLLELNWPAGRLVREYTFLLDPPEVVAKVAAPVASPVTKPVPAAKPVAEKRATSSSEEKIPAKPEAAKPRAPEEAKQPVESAGTREVKRGDTLSKIASAVKQEGVSLDQMLVGLFRANQDAFDGGNMNRLKAGKILSLPEKPALEAMPDGEARKIVVAQSSDWNAYRQKLAAVAGQSPVKDDAGKQGATGKITAKVEDKAAPVAEPKDQVKVSKSESAGAKSGAAAKRSEEDLIAKDKALKEANERLAILSKNNADLEKLVELKSQNLAELQKQAAAKAAPVEAKKPVVEAAPPVAPKVTPAPVPAPVAAPVPAPVVVPPAAPVVAEKPTEKPVEKLAEVKPVEPVVAKQEEIKPEPKPVEPVVAKPEPKPDEMPKPKPKPMVPPPPPVEEPGFVDELLDNPVAIAGGGGVLALLAGLFIYKRRRQGDKEKPLANAVLSQQTDDLSANSVFRSTGGQSVDTSHTPAQTDFSQAGPGSIDTDEVDPVAEADVYMAYGRDAQAEEILLEAKQKDPKRYAIHVKLLEIYSNRNSVKQFETLATDLYGETAGVGAEWEKAAAMGLKLDPQNPLFGGAAQSEQPSFDADATVIVSPQSLKNTVTLPGQLSQLADAASAAPPVIESSELQVEEVVPPSDMMSLDFDLGMNDTKTPSPVAESKLDMDSTLTLPEPVVESAALDFNIDTSSDRKQTEYQGDATSVGLDFNFPEDDAVKTSASVLSLPEPALGADLDFDIGSDFGAAPVIAEAPVVEAAPAAMLDVGSVSDQDLEFDVSLTESTVLGQPMRESSFDMSSINLDLAEPTSVSALQAPVHDDGQSGGFDVAQMNTVVNADFSSAQMETMVNPQFGSDIDLAPEFDITPNEEVATKLDLAKAYEEMGDLEGARELLQEVVKEGDAAQKEKAQALLAKIAV